MKRSIIVALFAVMLTSAAYAKPQPIAFTSESDQIFAVDEGKSPQGFRGLKFGEDITKVDGMTKVGEANEYPGIVDFYERKGDKMAIGDVKLKYINYVTAQGKLMDVYIDWEEPSNLEEARRLFSLLRATLFSSLGEIPSQFELETDYYWYFKDVQVHLSMVGSRHGIKYFHNPTHKILNQLQEQKKQAAEAKHEADVERAKNAGSDL